MGAWSERIRRMDRVDCTRISRALARKPPSSYTTGRFPERMPLRGREEDESEFTPHVYREGQRREGLRQDRLRVRHRADALT